MIELRSKCHGAHVKEVHDPELDKDGLMDYYECEKCGCMCEISLHNIPLDVQEKGRELFAWSAQPHTIGECVSWIEDLLKELNIGNGK